MDTVRVWQTFSLLHFRFQHPTKWKSQHDTSLLNRHSHVLNVAMSLWYNKSRIIIFTSLLACSSHLHILSVFVSPASALSFSSNFFSLLITADATCGDSMNIFFVCLFVFARRNMENPYEWSGSTRFVYKQKVLAVNRERKFWKCENFIWENLSTRELRLTRDDSRRSCVTQNIFISSILPLRLEASIFLQHVSRSSDMLDDEDISKLWMSN